MTSGFRTYFTVGVTQGFLRVWLLVSQPWHLDSWHHHHLSSIHWDWQGQTKAKAQANHPHTTTFYVKVSFHIIQYSRAIIYIKVTVDYIPNPNNIYWSWNWRYFPWYQLRYSHSPSPVSGVETKLDFVHFVKNQNFHLLFFNLQSDSCFYTGIL